MVSRVWGPLHESCVLEVCFRASSPWQETIKKKKIYESEQMKNFGASEKAPSSEVQLFGLWRETSISSL